jgi:hypothetical protein
MFSFIQSLRPVQSSGRLLIGHDVLALGKVAPELAQERSLIAVVQVAKHGLDGLGGFSGIVEGNATRRMLVNGNWQL